MFGEALEIDFPINHPAAIAATRSGKRKPTKHSPGAPLDFVVKVEEAVTNEKYQSGEKLFCSLFLLQVFASLRYIDLDEVSSLFLTETAVCGVSIDPKSANRDVMQWAAPKQGLGGREWFIPVFEFWETIKPPPGEFRPLYPAFRKSRDVNLGRMATQGTVQASLNRIVADFGCDVKLTTHSPRSWHAAMGKQLLYSRGDRESLGHWAPGSLMPDKYDRAVCATELRLRVEILAKIRDEWKPSGPFETPQQGGAGKKAEIVSNGNECAESSPAESTSIISTEVEEFSEDDISILDVAQSKIPDGSQPVFDKDGSKGYV